MQMQKSVPAAVSQKEQKWSSMCVLSHNNKDEEYVFVLCIDTPWHILLLEVDFKHLLLLFYVYRCSTIHHFPHLPAMPQGFELCHPAWPI